MIILPRQARDKHIQIGEKDSAKKERLLAAMSAHLHTPHGDAIIIISSGWRCVVSDEPV